MKRLLILLGQPRLLSSLEFINGSSSSVTVVWQAWNNNTDFGDGPVEFYLLYCNISGSLELCGNVSSTGEASYTETFDNLTHYTKYEFYMRVSRPGPGGTGMAGTVYDHVTSCISECFLCITDGLL